MNSEQEQAILSLRAKSLTPKQIARKLGLKVSQVSAVIKAQAEHQAVVRAEKGELAPVVECFVNADCAETLLKKEDPEELAETGGMAQVSVVRSSQRNRYEVATYLIDYWCLGLKDTIEPRRCNGNKYQTMIEHLYSIFPDGYEKITLQQAQAIVYGAIAYAKKLGFDPHPDFDKSREHLGEWDGQLQLEFGRDGQPFYMAGPYDHPEQIIETLRKNVGEGNFHYMMGLNPGMDIMALD